MQSNQTSIRGGIQDVLLPMTHFRCFQGDFEGNHPSYACDMSGKDTGRDLFYAPVDVKCVAINAKDGNTVWWQSVNKVRFADGTIDHLTMMVIHDNNLSGIYVGATYKQGQQIAQEGTAGMANGNHLHVEFAKGAFSKMYAQNAKGYYLPNSIAIETVCFKDDTTFVTSADWNWKSTSDVSVSEPSAPSTGGTVTLPASASTWRAYPTNVAPVVGNECGLLAPAQYGGLTYDIIGRPQTNVVTIKTGVFGTVNIYVGADTGAIIK